MTITRTDTERVDRAIMSIALVVLLIGAVLLAMRLADSSAPYDDAFITFRYARNFAGGQGFIYNPGDQSVGTTSPSFALLLGVVAKVTGVDPARSANWLSAFALALAAWFALRLVQVDFGMLAGIAAGLSVAFNPLLVICWGGEWLLASPALIAGFYYYRTDRLIPAAVMFSTAILLRPEAALAPLFPFLEAWWHRRTGVLNATLVAGAIGLGWLLTAWLVIGEVLPTTLATKLAHAQSGIFGNVLQGLASIGRQFIRGDLRLAVIIVLAWHGALAAAARHRVWRLMWLWIAVHLLFYRWLELPFYHWYLTPVALGISLAFGAAVPVVSDYLRTIVGSRRYVTPIVLIVLVLLVGVGIRGEERTTRAWIATKPDPRERMYNRIGEWLAMNTPADASVAYLEIGRIGYFSSRRIVDLMGLVTPGVAAHVATQDFSWALLAFKPDYYLISSTFTWAASPVGEPWFEEAYERTTQFSAPDFDSVIGVYRKRAGAAFPALSIRVEMVQRVPGLPVGEIVHGTATGQTFTPTHDRLAGVGLMFATFARQNSGPMTFRLQPLDTPGPIVEERFDMAAVQDNQWLEFHFAAFEGSGGKHFKLTIASDSARAGNAISVWYNPRDSYRGGERLINDTPAVGDLTLKLLYDPVEK